MPSKKNMVNTYKTERLDEQVELLLSHFSFSEVMEWCTVDQYETLYFMIENGWIELPPFLEAPTENEDEDE